MRPILVVPAAILPMLAPLSAAASAAEMVWPFTNSTRYDVDVQFYAPDRNWVWPQSGRVFFVRPGRKDRFRFSCRRGERVCFGAWIRGHRSGSYWGAGPDARYGCTGCCYTCVQGTVKRQLLRAP
jgi:hypothetical protein